MRKYDKDGFVKETKYVGDVTKLPLWVQRDISDMEGSRCTVFERCNECNRLHDETYICPHCGHDNSND